MSIKLAWVRCAVAVVDHGSFTAAARSLGVTQPTVSAGVASLEDSIGAALFVRTTRSIRTTALGDHLLGRLRALLSAQADLDEAVAAYRQPAKPLLRIGVSTLVDVALLHAVLHPYCHEHPTVEVVFKDCFVSHMDERLTEGSLDLAIGVGIARRPGRTRSSFYTEDLLYLPPGHTALGESVTVEQVIAHPVLMPVVACGLAGEITRLLAGQGHIYPGRAMTYEALAQWAELGIGGALLPRAKAPAGFPTILDDRAQPVRVTHDVVWQRDRRFVPHVDAAVRHFADRVPALVAGMNRG